MLRLYKLLAKSQKIEKMKKVIVRLSEKDDHSKTYDLTFKLEDNSFVPKWIDRYKEAQQRSDKISEPWAFYGLSDDWSDQRIVDEINEHINWINQWASIFDRQLESIDDQDTLNHIHAVFEKHHGKLDEWQQSAMFGNARGPEMRARLSHINQLVHRSEAQGISKKIRVVYFDLPKTRTFDSSDYELVTNTIEFGGLYSLYADVGKNIESLARDNDDHHHDIVPNLHYSVDFQIRFSKRDLTSALSMVYSHRLWIDENEDLIREAGYEPDDIRLTTGNIKIAQLEYKDEEATLREIAKYNHVQSVFVI